MADRHAGFGGYTAAAVGIKTPVWSGQADL
jgi:hypothetical protein